MKRLTPSPPHAKGTGLPWDVTVDDAVAAIDHTVAELGSHGTADVFGMTRRLGHRMGLASWAGPGSDAFVHPDAMAAVAASGRRAERAALDDVTGVIESAVRQMNSAQVTDGDLFGRIVDAWSSAHGDVRIRGTSLDVALIHIASMSRAVRSPIDLDGDVSYSAATR